MPTWCPFRLQFYCNGHNRLAAALDKAGIGYKLVDNAFVAIDDFDRAQKLADGLDVRELHNLLDRYGRKCCPVIKQLGVGYHWSIMQIEYATDIIFRDRSALAPLYEAISRTAIHAVKPEQVATQGPGKVAGTSRQRSALSDQHSAISTQRSALSDQHSAISTQQSVMRHCVFLLKADG